MSTTPRDSGAVDLADVTFRYPGVGLEVAMTVFAVVLWLGWHVWQIKNENKTYEDEIRKHGSPETIQKASEGGGRLNAVYRLGQGHRAHRPVPFFLDIDCPLRRFTSL